MLLKTDGKCDAGQNSDYSAGYSIGSLQGRKQNNYPQNIDTNSEKISIINRLFKKAHKPG
jgi:hypothetical protein